mgnify:CR=1 FL=1
MEDMINIMPMEDTIEHVEGLECPCNPESDGAQVPIITHNIVGQEV